MAETTAYLEKLSFWEHLSPDEKRFAERNSGIRRVEKNAFVYSRDCACLGFVLVISGSARTYLLSPEGREITLFRLKSGDPCVLSASCVIRRIKVETHMVAEEDTTLLVMNAEAFLKLTEQNIFVRCFLYECATESFSSVVGTMESILFSSFDERLASFLISEYDRGKSAQIRMTQSEIAKQVNSAREVVARMLKQFSDEGLVKVSRGAVSITDPEGLRAIAK